MDCSLYPITCVGKLGEMIRAHAGAGDEEDAVCSYGMLQHQSVSEWDQTWTWQL